MEKLKIHWVIKDKDLVGNALGYMTHNKFMRKYCEQYFDYDENADIALHIVSADYFKPIPGKFNILFTMWEFLDLPEAYIFAISKADALIVPSSFCKQLFRRYYDGDVHVCWEGVEPQSFPFFDRVPSYNLCVRKQNKFRFLWVGASNPRKGYPLVIEAVKLFEKLDNVEIYLKTTAPNSQFREVSKEIMKKASGEDWNDERFKRLKEHMDSLPNKTIANNVQHLGEKGNIILDTRKLSFDELVALYNSAHAFVLPTFGEGWGLTLCEAMATGAPCISTAVTGCADFFDESVGYPIKWDIMPCDLTENYGLHTKGYVPDTKDFIEKMIYVMAHYDEAYKKGKRASSRIHSKFTWERSALRLRNIIEELAVKV